MAKTVGEQLAELRARSSLSMEKLAHAMDLKGRSSVQRFFDAALDTLGLDDALRLADAFQGKGQPPIARAEVLAIGGFDKMFEATASDITPPRYREQTEDVPAYGTALGTFREDEDGPAIEQAFINYADELDYFVRPPKYQGHDGLYGFYVQGSSMTPRFDDGDPCYADRKRPPKIGDDVVVYLVRPVGNTDESWAEELDAVLVKTLVANSASFIELRQYNPNLTFRVERRRIKAIHRVLNRRDTASRM